MTQTIRILEVVNVMDRAGLETMLMNHYRAMDREQVQLDFLTHRPVAGAYDEEIRSLGGRVYRAPRLYPQNWPAYRKWMRSFFGEHNYRVVHSHIDAMSAFPLAMASECGVPIRIAHSHSDSVDRDIKYPIKLLARWKLIGIATHYWACSEAAGAFLFGEMNRNKIHVVKNAIDLEGFRFDARVRVRERAELGVLDSQLVIGHVGRFCAVKNHEFLIDLLCEVVRGGVNAVLVLVGNGELQSKVKRKTNELGLTGRVRFLGLRDDVSSLMQAFDLLAFPSLHEGIPLTLIEAQASGIPVLASDRVSDEALVLENSARLSLGAPMSEWAKQMLCMARSGRVSSSILELSAGGYEINASASALVESYSKLHGEASDR